MQSLSRLASQPQTNQAASLFLAESTIQASRGAAL